MLHLTVNSRNRQLFAILFPALLFWEPSNVLLMYYMLSNNFPVDWKHLSPMILLLTRWWLLVECLVCARPSARLWRHQPHETDLAPALSDLPGRWWAYKRDLLLTHNLPKKDTCICVSILKINTFSSGLQLDLQPTGYKLLKNKIKPSKFENIIVFFKWFMHQISQPPL